MIEISLFVAIILLLSFGTNLRNILAIVYAAEKKFDKANKEFEWEIRINPSDTLPHLNLGQIYWYGFQLGQRLFTIERLP